MLNGVHFFESRDPAGQGMQIIHLPAGTGIHPGNTGSTEDWRPVPPVPPARAEEEARSVGQN